MEAENYKEKGFTQFLIETVSGAKVPYNHETGQMILPDGNMIKLPDGTLHPEAGFETRRLYCPVTNQTIVLEMGPDYSACIRVSHEGKTLTSLIADFGAKSKEDITGCNCREFDENMNRLEQQIKELKK